MAKLSPPRHRELVRGMVAELHSIVDPADRTRFALGAIAAIARLTLIGYGRTTVDALGRFVGMTEQEVGTNTGGSSMSQLTTWQLLGRHTTPFALSFGSLTALLLAAQAARQMPQMSARGLPAATILEVLLLAVPSTMALTVPMAVFLAVSWVFTRLGADGVLASASRERHGVRRLVAPVLGAAAIVAAMTLVLNTQVLPRANVRLVTVLEGAPQVLSDRMMTIGELRGAARRAQSATGAQAAARAAGYEVEIHKKFALAVACLVLALAGAATAVRFPRGGVGLVLGASGFVFIGYWVLLVAGESLADRQAMSPLPAMWMANAFLLAVALLLLWRPGNRGPAAKAGTLAIGG